MWRAARSSARLDSRAFATGLHRPLVSRVRPAPTPERKRHADSLRDLNELPRSNVKSDSSEERARRVAVHAEGTQEEREARRVAKMADPSFGLRRPQSRSKKNAEESKVAGYALGVITISTLLYVVKDWDVFQRFRGDDPSKPKFVPLEQR